MVATNQNKPANGDKTQEIDIKKDLSEKSESSNEDKLLKEVGDIMDKAEQMKADSKQSADTAKENVEQTVIAPNVVANAPSVAVNSTVLKPYDDAISSLRGKNTFLSLVVVLTISALGFVSYEFYDKINTLNRDIQQVETHAVEKNTSALDKIKAENEQLNKLNAQIRFENGELKERIDALIKEQVVTLDAVKNLNMRVNKYEDKDPNAWKIAESFFEVKHAYQQLLLSYDTNAAITLLKQADKLLVGIQDHNILEIRQEIANDIVSLSAITNIDYQGILYTLNSVYSNIDKLTLVGYSEDTNFKPVATQKTDSIADWKNNLLESAVDFSSKFVEVRRRDSSKFEEFLTPKQDYFLRENIKARLLIAQLALSNHNDVLYKDNLKFARDYVNTYFEQDSNTTKVTIDVLTNLINQNVSIKVPNTLNSFELFNKLFESNSSVNTIGK